MTLPRTNPKSRLTAICTSIVLLAGWDCVGATITAANTSYVAVSNAVRQASSGDTVIVPAGNSTWTSTLSFTNDIQLIGAGIGLTVITDGGTSSTTQLINWVTSSNHLDRLSGFTFLGTTSTTATAYFTVGITGTSHAMRIDHCRFDTLQTAYNVSVSGWVYGVIDNNIFNLHGGGAMQVGHETYGGYAYGDGSWADADSWGTTNALYIESNLYLNYFDPAPGARGALDCENGARLVFRYNTSTNCLIGSHGTESGGRERSVRSMEIYNNYVFWDTNNFFGEVPWCIYVRGGTATIFSNTVYGGIQRLVTLADYRMYPNAFTTWLNISGVNNWDSNNATLFASGNCTAVANTWPVASMTDSGASWTPFAFNGYYVNNTNLSVGFEIISNSATTLYFSEYSPYAGGDNLTHWTVADGYSIHQVYAAIDQPGLGQGDLIVGDSPTPAWPHEVSDPVYTWDNNLTMVLNNEYNTNAATIEWNGIVSGRDYFNQVARPAYTPLVYPHPLTVMVTYTGTVLYNPILRFN